MTAGELPAIFLGGGLGASCRYALGRFIGERYDGAFPLGTFIINVTGCFTLGLLATRIALSHRDAALLTALLATGFLGAYTTFSTYALEGVLLFLEGGRRLAALTLVGSVGAGMLAAALGAALGRAL